MTAREVESLSAEDTKLVTLARGAKGRAGAGKGLPSVMRTAALMPPPRSLCLRCR